MAYNDSGELPASQSAYSLGGYEFELKVQTVHEPGEEDVVSVFAICHDPDGSRETQAVDFPEGTVVAGWYVETNETEASVYVSILEPKEGGSYTSPLDTGPFTQPIPTSTYFKYAYTQSNVPIRQILEYFPQEPCVINSLRPGYLKYLGASKTNGAVTVKEKHSVVDLRTGETTIQESFTRAANSFTYDGKTAYYNASSAGGMGTRDLELVPGEVNYAYIQEPYTGRAAWTILYGTPEYKEPKDVLIARFAIDIREADTDSWDEPGDDGPPGTTLNVTVTGATAGSCTGTPADNETVKGYGDGGDGGYGGGGGAGASTVIIYEFATSIADSVQQEAISRGPGTGGPGGKGGKGGDGCILIFY